MKTPMRLIGAVAAVLLAACDTVSSPVPLGEIPATVDAEHWDGRWHNAEGHIDVTVTDGANGLVRIGYEDNGDYGEMDLEVRRSGDWIFVNVTEKDFAESEGLATSPCTPAEAPQPDLPECDDVPPSYLWARVSHRDNAIIAWVPDAEAFVRLVEDRLLPGTAEDGSVVLGPLDSGHYRIITSGSHGVLLDWEHPMVLYRSAPGELSE